MKYDLAEAGWLAFSPVPDGWKRQAKAIRERYDERGVRSRFLLPEDDRYFGHLGEFALAAWLDELCVPYELDGGLNDEPDLVVAGMPVGVKTRSINAGFMRQNFVVNVYAHQREKEAGRHLFFCCYEQRNDRLLLLGAMHGVIFFERARLVKEGEPLNPVHTCLLDTYSLEARHLTPPIEWIGG